MRHIASLCLLLWSCVVLSAADAGGTGTGKDVFTDQEWSAAQRPAPTAAGGSRDAGLGTAATMLGGLVVVVVVAVALGWTIKRLKARTSLGRHGRHLEVLETVMVGPRRSLALVRCGTHWLVVGLGERELISVATLPAPIEALPPADPVASPAQPSAFASQLGRLIGGSSS